MIYKVIYNHHQLHQSNNKNTLDVKQQRRISNPASDSPLWNLLLLHESWDKNEGVSVLSQSNLSSMAFCRSAASERAALFMARCISQVAKWIVRKAPPAAHIQFLLSQLCVFMLHINKRKGKQDFSPLIYVLVGTVLMAPSIGLLWNCCSIWPWCSILLQMLEYNSYCWYFSRQQK